MSVRIVVKVMDSQRYTDSIQESEYKILGWKIRREVTFI